VSHYVQSVEPAARASALRFILPFPKAGIDGVDGSPALPKLLTRCGRPQPMVVFHRAVEDRRIEEFKEAGAEWLRRIIGPS
jgi:hypothetical protein